MKKFIGSIKRSSASRSKSNDSRNATVLQQQSLPQGDNPEAVVVREAFAFCEAGAPNSGSAGDEYLHLPAIVDATEASPYAAREVAVQVQRYLSKQNFERGYAQYNAIMLMRILTDNPGRVFTQNFDKNFISTIKALLRECKDSSVQQIMRETMDYFEAEKLNANDTLMPLIEMWRKEKGSSARMYSSSVGIPETVFASQHVSHHYQGYQGRPHPGAAPHMPREHRAPRGLPPPDELAARIEEAKTSARLLVQMVQSTPPNELLGNELIKEFAERARQAHKSIQQYMACESPAPDENTMLTLIETSDQLNISMSKHQRAMLQARKSAGLATPSPQPPSNQQDPFSTAAMQNALPPHQAPLPQQHEQPRYNQYESHDLYNNAAARVSPIEQSDHAFMPPPGPPPSQRQQPQSTTPQPNTYPQPYEQPYDQHDPSPVSPPRTHERSNSAAQAYGVPENPFADDNACTAPTGPPPSQKQTQSPPHSPQSRRRSQDSYSLFNRAAGQLRSPDSPPQSRSNRPITAELDASSYPVPPAQADRGAGTSNGVGETRPGYNAGWQPTPSFMHRQESSEAHITMSGASPPERR
ncbi:hypothetical protein PMZ80_002966 [Knufia obscura]|uniref:GAT domain-containing protein n=2 Tax=Knufia TaxID=430999 RepID=A0AAN8EIU9_9EURO|nr:hypothetical protein PMZ80_002966 [Knufia obscura]KAK5952448.1 hypothetical protein OHC33_006491 [Knufia fluminis]